MWRSVGGGLRWTPVELPVGEHTSYFIGTCSVPELGLCNDYDYTNSITIVNIV